MLTVALARIAAILVMLPVVHMNARQDTWIAIIVATLASSLISLMAASLAMKFPGKSFGQFANEVLGKALGIVSTCLVALSFYVLCLARTRMMSLIVITQFMPKTPGWGLAIPLLLTAFYGALMGPDTIGRSSELIFTVIACTISVGVVMVYLSRSGPTTGLKPILSQGMRPVLVASIPPTFLGVVSGAKVLALGRFTTKTRGLAKAVVSGTVIGGLFLLVIVVVVLTTLGWEQAKESVTPVLALASSIFIEGVIERADLLLLGTWILGVTFDVTALLMSAAILIADSFNAPYRPVLAALFLAGAIPVSHRITDVFMMRELNSPLLTGIWTLVVFIGVVGLVYVVYLARERKRKKP